MFNEKCINCGYKMDRITSSANEISGIERTYWCPACGTFIVLDNTNSIELEGAGWQTPFLSEGCGTCNAT